MNTSQRESVRTLVRGVYDLQKLRIQMGNRIVATFKAKLGQEPGELEEDGLSADGKLLLGNLRQRFKKITDGVVMIEPLKDFKGDELIDSYTELCLIAEYVELDENEKRQFRRLGNVLKEWPIWTQYLEGVKGIGPAMAGVIVSEIDISKARHPSSLWKYAGLDVADNGAGRSRKADHLIDKEYVDAEGEVKTRKSITFNPWLKTKLIGVLASSFLRAGDGPYRTIYDGYKSRLEQHPNHKDKSKGWRHNMAMRYMVKMFLIDLYTKWRAWKDCP